MNFRDLLNEELKNPEFKKEWDALEEEYRQIRLGFENENTASPFFRRCIYKRLSMNVRNCEN